MTYFDFYFRFDFFELSWLLYPTTVSSEAPMTAALHQHTVLPPADDRGGDLQRLADRLTGPPAARQARLVGPDGSEMAVPDEVYAVLRDAAEAMAKGLAISIAPLHAVLTTQQAADMLNISRPTLVKLLEQHEIPFEQRGRHRRVRLSDVLEYQQRSRSERRVKLAELTRTASEDGTADNIDGFIQTR